MRARRDADDAVADLADLLAGLDVLTDTDQIGAGVPVVHLHALERARGDLQDRRVRAETADPLPDDDAIAHRVQRRATRSRVVDALIDIAVDEVAAWEGERDPVGQHVRRRLCRRCRGRDHRDSPGSPVSRAGSSTRTAAGACAGRGTNARGPAGVVRRTDGNIAARGVGSTRSGLATAAGSTRGLSLASAVRSTRRLPLTSSPGRCCRGLVPDGVCAHARSGDGCTLAERRASAGEVPAAGRRRSRYRRGRSSVRGARRPGGLVQHQHGSLEHDRPRLDIDRAGQSEAVTALEVAHRAQRPRAEDPVHGQMRQWKDLVQAPLSRRHQRSLAAHPEHHPLTVMQRAIGAGVGAAGRVGNRSRLSGPDCPWEDRTRGERRAQCQRRALLPAPGAASQLREPPALTRTSEGTLPQLHRSKISNERGPFAYRIKARRGQ